MIRLVVNADDGGIDAARNRGILAAIREGIVRSISVIAAAPAAEELLAALREFREAGGPAVGLGLHLNLTQGRPLVGQTGGFAGGDGRFVGKEALWRRGREGRIDPAAAVREIQAQLAWLEDRGCRPDHLDGHNHVHILPGVAEALAEVLPRGLWVRLPLEEGIGGEAGAGPAGSSGDEAGRSRPVLAALSRRAAALWGGRFRHPDLFRGLLLIDGYDAGTLSAAIGDLIDGARAGPPGDRLLEVMVHPGEVDGASVPFSALPAREAERDALRSPPVRALPGRLGAALARFGDAP